MAITLSLTGGATVLIGCPPTYQQIGTWAPILLTLLRVVQGRGIGGERGALLPAHEYAPKERKGLFGRVPQVGVAIGILQATMEAGQMAMLPEEAFLSWAGAYPSSSVPAWCPVDCDSPRPR